MTTLQITPESKPIDLGCSLGGWYMDPMLHYFRHERDSRTRARVGLSRQFAFASRNGLFEPETIQLTGVSRASGRGGKA